MGWNRTVWYNVMSFVASFVTEALRGEDIQGGRACPIVVVTYPSFPTPFTSFIVLKMLGPAVLLPPHVGPPDDRLEEKLLRRVHKARP